ncbi:hypothetical protein [Nonomuraea sp. SYSU D8015]|uniref:hypothetical protein n=1 Tax=Nonomuraea sp. SYSU D8015 TaxID=2593644 RepID=UPI0016616E46|nr:hypothetical protein [Nonomuraea sp. SYSU D8015]
MPKSIYDELSDVCAAVMVCVESDFRTDWPTEAIDAILARHGESAAIASTATLVRTFSENWKGVEGEAIVQGILDKLIKETEVPGDFEAAREAIAAAVRGEPFVPDPSLASSRDVVSALLWVIVQM